MSDDAPRPSALWPTPAIISAPAGAPSAFALAQIDIPPALSIDVDTWLPHLVATERLHADEAALVAAMPPTRRATFVAGRLAMRSAMRAALAAQSSTDAFAPILRTDRGAPVLPASVAGSVSHKHDAALALMRPITPQRMHVGVDLEHRPTERDLARPSIAKRILTGPELDALAQLEAEPLRHRERIVLSFAIKEAIYKAIDPTVRRYVRFTEVALAFSEHGHLNVSLLLPELANGELEVHAHYALHDRWIVATATATADDTQR